MKKYLILISLILFNISFSGENNIIKGNPNTITGDNNVVIGNNNTIRKNSSVTIGNENSTGNDNSVAIGITNMPDIGGNNVSIGFVNYPQHEGAIAIGNGMTDGSAYSIGMGEDNSVKGEKSFVLGKNNKSFSLYNKYPTYTIGDSNYMVGIDSYNFGTNNWYGEDRYGKKDYTYEVNNHKYPKNMWFNYVFGSNVRIDETKSYSIVLGNESESVYNSLSIGNNTNLRRIANVAKGVNESDAITLKQFKDILYNKNTDNDFSSYLFKDLSNSDDETLKNQALKLLTTGNISSTSNYLISGKILYNYINSGDNIYSKNKIDELINNRPSNNDYSGLLEKGEYTKLKDVSLLKSNVTKEFLSNILDNKELAETDSSNINVWEYKEVLSKSNLITDKNLHDNLSSLYNKNEIEEKIDDKANVSGDNIEINKYIQILSLGKDGHKLITDRNLKEILENSYIKSSEIDNRLTNLEKKDGSNIEVDAYTKKLEEKGLLTDTKSKKMIDERLNTIDLIKSNEKLQVFNNINEKSVKANAGIASAIAISSLPQINITDDRILNISFGYGMYGREHAFALGVSGGDPNGNVIARLNSSINTKVQFSVGLGLAYQFGISYNDEDLEIKNLTQKVEDLENLVKKLK
jgi:hypothetical protein